MIFLLTLHRWTSSYLKKKNQPLSFQYCYAENKHLILSKHNWSKVIQNFRTWPPGKYWWRIKPHPCTFSYGRKKPHPLSKALRVLSMEVEFHEKCLCLQTSLIPYFSIHTLALVSPSHSYTNPTTNLSNQNATSSIIYFFSGPIQSCLSITTRWRISIWQKT